MRVKWKSLSCVLLFATPRNSPGQNSGVGSLCLLQGIFPTQGSNPGVPHCRRILYQLSHRGSPKHALVDILNSCDHNVLLPACITRGFPRGSVRKESACSAGDLGSIPGSGRSPGEGNNNPLQFSCLENPMDRGAWWATVHEATRVRHDWETTTPPPTSVQ